MSLYSQPSPDKKGEGIGKHASGTSFQVDSNEPKALETWQKLQEALRHGMTVSNTLWLFRMTDWIVGIQAADLDNDGEIEILLASRDGWIKAFTRFGLLKWETLLEQSYINALAIVPFNISVVEKQPCIIVGLRNGKVLALDKNGDYLKDWGYDTERIIRQVYISPRHPDDILVASEDRRIHVLDRITGRSRWSYATLGWVRCVLMADLDEDGEEEILCGSGDKHLYIFNQHGKLLHSFNVGHQVYALAASPPGAPGPVRIIMSSNSKDLAAWEVTRTEDGHWRHERLWISSTSDKERLIENRGHAICVQDLNNDGIPEILVGSEDGYLIVVDYHGQLLWKQHFHSCVYRLSARDINRDGQVEILVGTENNYAHVLQLDLVPDLSKRIKDYYAQLTRLYQRNWSQITRELTLRESILLKDFVEEPSSRPHRMEIEEGQRLVEEGQYKAALAVFSRLLQENIQYCWSQPFTSQGYIWTGCLTNLDGLLGQGLVVGTDQGYVYGLGTQEETAQMLWEQRFSENDQYRVRMLCPGPEIEPNRTSIVVVLSDYRVALLDNRGQIMQDRFLSNDWARCACYYPGDEHQPGTIIIGMENNEIAFWDETLQVQVNHTIHMPQGVGAICVYDILGSGRAQIISGTLKNRVYAHTWEGEVLWHFQTRDRVQALHVADIDHDGRAEIIVGSEDRYVYVLDDQGHLKWRYRTRRGVMDIDVCDIKMERDSANPTERTLKVLVSSADGYLYMFSAEGDMLWRYQSTNRERMVRAADMNEDGHFEIAIASEDQLELLQIIDRDELVSLSDFCWDKLIGDNDELFVLRELSEDADEYIRGRALARLAGTPEHTEEDFRRLLRAQRNDKAFQVKLDLVRAVVNLHSVERYEEARQLLERLYQDPEEEIRQQIMRILPLLGESLAFEYLERSVDYPDLWVRHSVVKQLDRLITVAPQQSLRLLLKTAHNEEEWVRQETGHVLAHYFEAHLERLVPDLLSVLEQETDLGVFQQLVYSVRSPALKGFFLNMLHQMQVPEIEKLPDMLEEAIHWINVLNESGLFYGEDLLQVYEEFRQLLHVRTISAIAAFRRITRPDILSEASSSLAKQLVPAFDGLEEAARIVAAYERRQTIGERVSSLIQAEQTLEKVREDLHQHLYGRAQPPQQRAYFPQNHILLLLIERWSSLIRAELARMRGSAHLVCELGTTSVPDERGAVVVLNIENKGECAADNVRIELEGSPDFEILEGQSHTLAEVSTRLPQKVTFLLHLHVPAVRLVFRITYDDAEKRNKQQPFAGKVWVKHHERVYHLIENPYTTGTPIRDSKMFYGRKQDLQFLRDSLGSISTNRVVLLWGQRRMGKTSLIYQLTNELAVRAYAPVFIDLQKLAFLETANQLLEGFAQHIAEQIYRYKRIKIPNPVHEEFLANPSQAFDQYLALVRNQLPNNRLILLIDEFDGMSKYSQGNDNLILYYLRNLMQHYPGINFLLSGATHIPHMEGYQAVFFNIAQELHLGKLKPEEARELITDPVRRDLDYDPLALARMMELTDGWPYFIHVMSEKLIQHCNAFKKSYVTIGEVNAALNLTLEEQASSLRWIWQSLSSPIEKLVLALLAQDKGAEGRIFSLNDIRQDFDAYGVPYDHKAVIEALRKLKREDFVEEQFAGVQYSIPVGLIKNWLRKEKPPERVVREENVLDGWDF